MRSSFNRADSGFTRTDYRGRQPNLADRYGQDSVPSRVQEAVSSYNGMLDWKTLEKCLRAIWPSETKETLNPKLINDSWVFAVPRKLESKERAAIAEARDEKKRSQRPRRRSVSPE